MKKLICFLFCVSLIFTSCNPPAVDDPDDPSSRQELGTVHFSFIFEIPGLPERRIKRLSLRLAYTQDSLNHGLFFTSTNVSDVISDYSFDLPERSYYYQATIMCLCKLDSCKYSGFSGQYGTRAVGNRIDVVKNQVTEVTTQFQ